MLSLCWEMNTNNCQTIKITCSQLWEAETSKRKLFVTPNFLNFYYCWNHPQPHSRDRRSILQEQIDDMTTVDLTAKPFKHDKFAAVKRRFSQPLDTEDSADTLRLRETTAIHFYLSEQRYSKQIFSR